MNTFIYYLFAVSFSLTAISGIVMLVSPGPWLALQKWLLARVSPQLGRVPRDLQPHAEAYLKVFTAVPVRVVGAVYLLFGAVALYVLLKGYVTMATIGGIRP